MLIGEATALVKGVTPEDVFDFVLDPRQYTKADTKIVWVTKLQELPDGMIAREDGRFLGKLPGHVITRYRWKRPNRIDVTLEKGAPRGMHAWFEIEPVEGGTFVRHVESVDMGSGIIGWLHDNLVKGWWDRSIRQEVAEIARLLEAGERGRPIEHEPPA